MSHDTQRETLEETVNRVYDRYTQQISSCLSLCANPDVMKRYPALSAMQKMRQREAVELVRNHGMEVVKR